MKKQNRKLAQGAKLLLAGVALAAVASTPLMAGAASLGSSPFAVKAVYSSDSKFWAIKPFLKTSGTTEPGSGSTTTPPTTTPPTDPNPRTVAMTIDTRLPGCVPSQFNLQVWGDIKFFPDAQINWGDGSAVTSVKNGDTYAHSYGSGQYNLTIDGTLMGLYRNTDNNNSGANSCIKSVDHLGSETGMTMLRGFLNKATNVQAVAAPPASVTDYRDMLLGATSFNGDVSSWNTSKVTDFTGMFYGATSFNQPVNSWNMSSATSIANMFYGASSFNQPLNGWTTSKVTNMSGLFKNATSFNQPLDKWDTSNVDKGMSIMFEGATSFNQDISSWNVSKVQNFTEMFDGAKAFNQPLGAKWKPVAATQVGSMFADATSFKQDLSSWDFSSVPVSEKRSYAARSAMIAEYLPKGIPVQDGLTGVN